MKPFDDKDLIAYHLHELSPRRARALERALQTNPSLAAESEAYAATLRAFKSDAPLAIDEEVFARNWRALRPSLPAYRVRPFAPSRWKLPALAAVGLAFAATSLFLGTHHHAPTSATTSSSRHLDDTARSTPSLESSSVTAIPTYAPIAKDQGSAQTQRRVAGGFAPPAIADRQEAPAPRIASLPHTAEPQSVLHFIPLAPVAPLALLGPPSLPITANPAPVQTIVSIGASKSRHERTSARHEHGADLTLAMGGTLIGTRSVSSSDGSSHSQGATHAVSAIAAFHQQLGPAVGYRLAVSYTRPDFQNSSTIANTSSGQTDIVGSVYELATTYVAEGPHRGGFSTLVEAGAGLMGFKPSPTSTNTSYNLRGAAVAGIAADFTLSKHLGLHVAYRVQAFKGPDFNDNGVVVPVATTTLISNEPMLGITYRFHHK